MIPKFPFPCGLHTEAVRYRTFFGRRKVAVASTILFKDLNSTVAKRGLVFIGLMTSDGAIWFR